MLGGVGGHGTLMSSAGTIGMGSGIGGVGAPPGLLQHGSMGGNGNGGGGGSGGMGMGTPGGNGASGGMYGNGGIGVGGGGGGNGQNTAPGSVIDSRAVSVVVTLPGGPGGQHAGQALSDYGPI